MKRKFEKLDLRLHLCLTNWSVTEESYLLEVYPNN